MSDKKTVWMVCISAQPPAYDTHLRHQKIADKLIKKGYNVIIIAGSFLHYNKRNLINSTKKYIENEYEGKHYVFIKIPSYYSNGIKRVFATFLFALKVFLYRNKFKKPDFILHNLHVPFDFFVYFASLKLKAKYITEVWDLWPESFVAFGLLKKNNIFLKMAYVVERFLYQKADRIIFTMEGAKDYLIEKEWTIEQGGKIDLHKYININNGIDLKDFDFNREHYIIEDEDLINDTFFKVVYLGSIRLANDVKLLIDAANLLKEVKQIKFLIYGDGDERDYLERYCEVNHIDNVFFKEKWIEIKYVPYILSYSSLNILNYKKNSVAKYGGSQGKLFQYMASGKPICSNQIMGYDLVMRFQIGIAGDFESAVEYAKAIREIFDMPRDNYNQMCMAAREAAKTYDYNVLSEKFSLVLDDLLKE